MKEDERPIQPVPNPVEAPQNTEDRDRRIARSMSAVRDSLRSFGNAISARERDGLPPFFEHASFNNLKAAYYDFESLAAAPGAVDHDAMQRALRRLSSACREMGRAGIQGRRKDTEDSLRGLNVKLMDLQDLLKDTGNRMRSVNEGTAIEFLKAASSVDGARGFLHSRLSRVDDRY